MAVFKYKALDQQGKPSSGRIEAADLGTASSILRSRSLYIVKISNAAISYNPFRWLVALLKIISPGQYRSPSAAIKVIMFKQLALMIRSGNTLTQGLEICAQMTENNLMRRALIYMLISIQGGFSFSVAIEAQKGMFPPVAAKLVAAAEVSGELQTTLERLADNLERSAQVRKQFISSLTYPMILFSAAVAVFLGLSLGIVPKFAKMLENKSDDLPAMTQAMLDVSAWLVDYGAALGITIGLVVFSILAAYTTSTGKKLIDNVLINTPLIGSSIRTSAMSQMGWTMSMLLGSGLTVIEALRVMSSITDNRRLAQCFDHAGEQILAGRSLAFGFNQSHIPVMVQHMTGIGERSGELEHVMLELGKFYQQSAESRIKTMVAMIEPAMTIIVGGMVAFVYIGFFSAMIKVSAG